MTQPADLLMRLSKVAAETDGKKRGPAQDCTKPWASQPIGAHAD
jgi:hypothetical protein